jgi:hypothetical protein
MNNQPKIISMLVIATTAIVITLGGCFTDVPDAISFEIRNQYHQPIEVKFVKYVAYSYLPAKDTIFVIPSGERKLVYNDEALVLKQERYVKNDSLVFCDSIVVSSGSLTSSRNIRLESEWNRNEGDDGVLYSLIVDASDF